MASEDSQPKIAVGDGDEGYGKLLIGLPGSGADEGLTGALGAVAGFEGCEDAGMLAGRSSTGVSRHSASARASVDLKEPNSGIVAAETAWLELKEMLR